jgi:acetolactate synthase-1/2/3 large subunit
MVKVAGAYGIPARRVLDLAGLDEAIDATLAGAGPALCDVLTTPSQNFQPRVVSERMADGRIVSKPLEDMYPFLDRDEFRANMLIPEWRPVDPQAAPREGRGRKTPKRRVPK